MPSDRAGDSALLATDDAADFIADDRPPPRRRSRVTRGRICATVLLIFSVAFVAAG